MYMHYCLLACFICPCVCACECVVCMCCVCVCVCVYVYVFVPSRPTGFCAVETHRLALLAEFNTPAREKTKLGMRQLGFDDLG